jgi:hypothetical protein
MVVKASDLGQLREHLHTTFARWGDITVALSGSLSRGGFRVSESGEITSDLDLIPIVAAREHAATARKELKPVLGELADRFDLTCTAAITLAENFLRARHAPYVTSIGRHPFLCDGLALEALMPSPAPDPALISSWQVQPVTYYLAKSGYTETLVNLKKALLAFRGLADPEHRHATEISVRGSDPAGLRAACAAALTTLVKDRQIELLSSSREFLARHAVADTGPETFFAVRHHAFLENQGIPFEESAMIAHPSHRR